MARETNSIATVWDIDNSNGLRNVYDNSVADETCCLKPMLSGVNAYWRNTIVPTGYSSNTMFVKFSDLKFAAIYNGGFSTQYTKSGDAASTLMKWVKISNLGIGITGANGATVKTLPYTMSAYTSAASIPIPYTVCSGDRVTFETSAATFQASNMSGTSSNGLGGIVISGNVIQNNNGTFFITGTSTVLNPMFVLYGMNSGGITPTGGTPTPSGTTYRTVTINLSQTYNSAIYGIQTGNLRMCTGTTAAAAQAAAKSTTALSITSQISNLTITGYTKYNSGTIIKTESFQIPSNAYLCISGSSSYPLVRTTATGAWVRCGWFSGATSTTSSTVQVTNYTFMLPPTQNSFYMIAGMGMFN